LTTLILGQCVHLQQAAQQSQQLLLFAGFLAVPVILTIAFHPTCLVVTEKLLSIHVGMEFLGYEQVVSSPLQATHKHIQVSKTSKAEAAWLVEMIQRALQSLCRSIGACSTVMRALVSLLRWHLLTVGP
jgi:hypothetical protein